MKTGLEALEKIFFLVSRIEPRLGHATPNKVTISTMLFFLLEKLYEIRD
jgi:hypothetical protein